MAPHTVNQQFYNTCKTIVKNITEWNNTGIYFAYDLHTDVNRKSYKITPTGQKF